MGVHGFWQYIHILAPDLIQNGGTIQDLVFMLDKKSDQGKLKRGQIDRLSLFFHFILFKVDLHVAEAANIDLSLSILDPP